MFAFAFFINDKSSSRVLNTDTYFALPRNRVGHKGHTIWAECLGPASKPFTTEKDLICREAPKSTDLLSEYLQRQGFN